jgi:beta-lactamase superfamily II metal-dependent hydrolase
MKRIFGIVIILILLLGWVSCDKSESELPSIPDTTAPSIANVSAENITEITAIVNWTTDEPATSQVEYGKTITYGLATPLDSELVTSHSVSITGLEPDSTYHFSVKSEDLAGNEAVSGDYAFTTIGMLDQLVIHFIDVGQGDAILIDYGTNEILIDGGRWGDCAVYVPSYIDGALEVMVATHPDADHIGGLDDILDIFDVDHIWLNGDTASTQTYTDFMTKVNAEGAQVHQAQRGDQISLGTLTFDVLHPTLPLGSDKNENSIVLKLSFGQVDFLFTGDAGSSAEASMLAVGLIDDIDILKVSHHGSKYCSTANFLAAAQPEIAIYSAGANNTYGHPAPETITRICDIGATIYGTDVHGTIVMTTNGTTYNVHPSNTVPPVDCSSSSAATRDLTINVNGQGTTNPSLGTHTYDDGTQVTITTSPAFGWKFDHWSGDTSGTSPTIVITMDSNKKVTAYFTQDTYAGSNVQITYIFYDGLVYRVESDEYVEITNLGSEPQDLAGWVLRDISEGYPSFTFPSYILAPGAKIRVYTNEIHPEWGGFSFGFGKAVWHNTEPDTAALFNAQGQEVSRRSY